MSKAPRVTSHRWIASLLIQAAPSWAENGVAIYPVPPVPPPAVVDEAAHDLGNPLNKPITGAAQVPAVAGGERPPSLETLQAARAGAAGPGSRLRDWPGGSLHQSGLSYGAQGGLAARAFAINEMLRRYEAMLDSVYDFGPLVIHHWRKPDLDAPSDRVASADGFLPWGDAGQVARETACVYSITRAGATGLGAAKLAVLFGSGLGLAAIARPRPCCRGPKRSAILEQVRRPKAGRKAKSRLSRFFCRISGGFSAISSAWRGIASFCGRASLKIRKSFSKTAP